MPVNLRYSAALDTTYSNAMDDDDDGMSSTWRSRSRTSLAGSSDSLDLLVSGSGTGSPSGSGSGHSRQTSADSGADSRNSASPSAEQKEVVIASSSARGLKSTAKPAHNPLQFVKTGVCPLYKKAAEQMKKAEEVRKVRQMTREQEEEWQSNLDNWKSKRRQIGQKSLDEALDDRQQQMEDRHRRQQQQRKSKTFSEMMEERTRRSVASKVVIYHDDDEWSASPRQPQPNGNGNKADNLNDNESALSPTPRLDTSFDSSLSDHVFNEELKSDMLRSEAEQVVPDVTPPEECTFENAIRSYTQYAESRTSRGSSVASVSQRSSSFSSCSNSSHAVPLSGQGDHDEPGGRGPSPAQTLRRDIGDQITLLVVLKRGEPRDFGFGTKSGRENVGSVLVESVQADGPADMAGLRVNDEVLSINGESTSNRSHSAIVFAIKQAVYTGSLELRVHRAQQPGQTATVPHTEQDADPGATTPRSGSVMKRRSLFERATSPAEDSHRERENLSRNVKPLDVAESLKERLASFESPEPRGDRPHSCNDPLEDIRTDSSFQEKLRTFQIMNLTESDERRQISATGPSPNNKRKTSHQVERERQLEKDNKRQFERTQSCGVLRSTACDQREGEGVEHGDHTVPCAEFEARMDTGSPSSGGFQLAETLQETAIVGSRPTSPDSSHSKFPEDVPCSPANELTLSTAKQEPVETTVGENQDFDLENNCSLNDREVPIMLDEDEYLVPIRMAEPPKEKPPPPPVDPESTVDPLPVEEKVPMSISQDIWRRRSNFLGTKVSELEDFIEREIRHVNSPPDMETLLKAERQQEESSRRERGNSVRSWDGTDLCVASRHEALYENVPVRHHRLENDSNCDDDDIARKEQEIIENLEREERQKGDSGKLVRTTNGNEVSPGHGVPEDRDTWEEALKLRAKEEELRRQEELLRLEKEKLRQEQEILMRQKEAYKQQIEQHRQMMPSASTSLQTETSTRPKSAPPPPPTKPRPNHHTPTPSHRPPCSPPLASTSAMSKDLNSVTVSSSATPNHYDEPRALTLPISASHSPGQPSWSASSSSSASLSMSSSTASSALSTHSASASPRAKLTDDDRWKTKKPSPEDCSANLQRHWVVQEAEMRRMAEHNERTKDEDRSYSVPQPLISKMGQPTNSTRDSEYSYAYGMHAPAVRYTPAVGGQTRPDVSARTVTLDQHNHRGHDVKQMAAPLPAPRRPLPSTPVAHEQQSAVQSQTVTNGNGVGNSHHRDPQMLSVSGKKKCSHCKEELGRGAAMVIESLELFYHIHCFQCCVCHVQLGNGLSGADVRVRNHKLHCHNCYSSDDGLKFSKV